MQRLVKAYQEEIDALAKRSRASDSAFFSLYKSLYEAPDPAQALERLASERPRTAISEESGGVVEVMELSDQAGGWRWGLAGFDGAAGRGVQGPGSGVASR